MTKIVVCSTLAVGASLWGGMAKTFNAKDSLSYEPNIACVKGSPYGKVLALAVQGPIDVYWHNGVTHEDAEILSEEQGGGGHGHDHGDHGHDHGDHDHDNCGHDHGDADQDHPVDDVAPKTLAKQDTKPLQQRAKKKIQRMGAWAHRKTDGRPLSEAHRKYLQGVTEDKLKLAYQLDPSNYTNYGNYHLFISATNLGKDEADDDRAVALARQTLEFCKEDQVDPASWLTAASAAYNIVYHIGRHHEQFTIPEAKASLAEFDFCIQHFEKLCQNAVLEGRIVSEVRLKEMRTRARYLGKLREAQGVYMKRTMTGEMAKRPAGNHSKSN